MPENKNAMQKRHRLELKQFQQKKADDAKKWRGLPQQEVEKKKKEMELLERELLQRQEEELKSFSKENEDEEPSFEELEKKRREEMEKVQEKATKEREKKKQKELERQKYIETESKNSLKEQELESIRQKLVNLRIKPIESDGNCLYRALADQYNLHCNSNVDYKFIRKEIAQYMRQHETELSVFLDKENISWSQYCDQVEFSSEWGGQLEVKAFCEAMHLTVNIVQGFDLPNIVMIDESTKNSNSSSPILNISYHKHYYSLGEHYNSLVVAP